MEESPHKCPVCSRSFNQRSNLKTHLLTHTDHKPYECTSCGKVFRRNCDLRRHALTHAVGDVPPESLDERDDDKNSDDEDDAVLEVDSPAQSPGRNTPSSVDVSAASDNLDDEDEKEDEEEGESSGVTHCHHERQNGSASPYTMRPQHEYREPKSGLAIHDQPLSLTSTPQSSPDSFVPMLHVRRDLHTRGGRISSSMLESNYINSIPIRKRPIGLDGEPYPRNIIAAHYQGLMRQSIKPSQLQQSRTPQTQSSSEISLQSKPSSETTVEPSRPSHTTTPIASPNGPAMMGVVPASTNVPPPAHMGMTPATPPTKKAGKTGFSIEDIMRR